MKLLSRVSLLAIATAAVARPGAAQAQVATNIAPDTAIGRSLGTNVSTIGTVTTIDNGTLSGTNLFHSFANFDLGSGDTAQWVYSSGNPSSITNVINRVTGGSASSIEGIIDSTALPNADFYFVNPAGVLFGAGAEVNVPAAARFSTSSELRFSNGEVFNIATPNGSTLSVAAPQSFGFLGGEGDISLTNIENGVDTTFLPGGGPLTLVAANIALDNAFIGSKTLALAAVGDMAAEVALDGTSEDLLTGAISLSNGSWLQTWPGGCLNACLGNAGTIRLQAGTIAIDNSNVVADFDAPFDLGGDRFVSLVATDTISVTDGAIMSNGYDAVSAGGIGIQAGGMVNLSSSQVSSYTEGAGNAGEILILGNEVIASDSQVTSESFGDGDAGRIILDGYSSISLTDTNISSSSVLADGLGNAGNVILTSNGDMDIIRTAIQTTSLNAGKGGQIILVAANADIADQSFVSSQTLGLNDGGKIDIGIGGLLRLTGNSIITTNAGLSGEFTTAGAGEINISADVVEIDSSIISSTAFADGPGGQIDIQANRLDFNLADINSNSEGGGVSGDIRVFADQANLLNSEISSNAIGSGDGGSISVAVDGQLNLTNSKVSSSSGVLGNPIGSTGRAGDILMTAGSLILDGSQIEVDAFDDGDGGSIFISVAGDIDMRAAPLDGLGHISSNAWRNGDGGDVSIFAGGTIRIVEGGISSRAGISISFTRGPGFGGDVILGATSLEMTDAVIQSNARGEADGGTVTLAISDMLSMEHSRISTISLGSGRAGSIAVDAGSAILIDSEIDSSAWETGDGGNVALSVGSLSMTGGAISSSTLSATGAGSAGNVLVTAGLLEMTDGAEIGSSAMGDGQGGSVFVNAAAAFLSASNIQSNAHGLGDAGGISITSNDFNLADGSIVQSTSYGAGRGGSVAIMADSLFVTSGSLVAADSLASGDAGDVFIDAFVVSLSNGAVIGSRSAGSGNGGLVAIETNLLDMSETSWILTTAFASGDAGNIVIAAGDIREQESTIDSTSYGDGAGGSIQFEVSGNMTVDASKIATNTSGIGDGGLISGLVAGHFAILNDSNITANALGDGRAGDVELRAGTMTVAGLSSIASNARGAGDGGNVLIAVDGLVKMDQGGISTNAGNAADGDQPAGNAGTVEVTAGSLDMRWSGIGSSSYDGGDGGAVGIKVAGAMIMDLSNVTSDSTGTGDAGIVAIEAASLAMRDGSVISSDAVLDGDAGQVLVDIAGDLVISDLSRISSNVGESLADQSTGDAGAILVSARNLIMDEGFIYSISFGDGDSGFVNVSLTGALSMTDSIISSNAQGELGNGGALFVEAASASLNRSSIASDTYANGDAGSVEVKMSGALALLDHSFISSDTLGGLGNGGDVTIVARDILLDGESFISSIASADGDGGFVDVTATNSLVLSGETAISTNVYGAGLGGGVFVTAPSILLTGGSFIASTAGEFATGDAGDVFIEAGDLVMNDGSSIASDADGSGESGFVDVTANLLDMSGGATISTKSMNENPAGIVSIEAGTIAMTGLGTAIASENLNPDEGGDNSAGSVFITAGHVVIAEGARVATNSLNGIAGDISFDMPAGSILILEGVSEPGVIETSSGPGQGGVISISNPLAIISNGGRISALGDSGGANVQIDTDYFIVSSDRLNIVEVNGTLAFANAIYDVTAGTVDADLTIVDASSVLRNHCSAARSSGELSQLQLRSVGPFGSARSRETTPVEKPTGFSGGCH